MTKKRTDDPAPKGFSQSTRHARIELPDEDYQRLQHVAKRVHISIAAYIRQAVMERIIADEAKEGAQRAGR